LAGGGEEGEVVACVCVGGGEKGAREVVIGGGECVLRGRSGGSVEGIGGAAGGVRGLVLNSWGAGGRIGEVQ